jgi:hypothetical protein
LTDSSVLKMETECSSCRLVTVGLTALLHIPEDHNRQLWDRAGLTIV